MFVNAKLCTTAAGCSDEQKTFYGHFKEKNGLYYVLFTCCTMIPRQGVKVYLTALFRCHVFTY